MNIEITIEAKEDDVEDKELVIEPYMNNCVLLQILRHGNCNDSIVVSIEDIRAALRKVCTK